METAQNPGFTTFAGPRRIGRGTLSDAALAARSALEDGAREPVLVFADATGRVVDVDLRGTEEEVRARARVQEEALAAADGLGPSASEGSGAGPSDTQRGRGRPRLGVVAREVTLLPRHWAWLATQRGGASATLRRLVEEARKSSVRRDEVRRSQDTAFKFMWAMGGDLPGYEEAIRALYAGDAARFDAEVRGWPRDLAEHARRLASDALRGAPAER